MIVLGAIAVSLSVLSAGVFIVNLRQFRRLPKHKTARLAMSVLIPARNERRRIGSTLRSLMKCRDIEIEIIVLDDESSDETARVVRTFSKVDSRIRLETSTRLQNGWCGKTFACQQLASLARHPLLLFLDADVQVIRRDALSRLASVMEESNIALASGFPQQETKTFAEKLMVPLIQFVLLAFLPIRRMRRTTAPAFAVASGQLVAVRREVYEKVGGHAAVATSLHDGLMLARNFRAHGFVTDIFDASDCFKCRMYQTMKEVWNGFLKNAHEGLGSPQLIPWATVLLFGGQVLPFCLLVGTQVPWIQRVAAVAAFASWLPRFIGVVRFRESLLAAILHPLGVLTLLVIQWSSLLRSLAKRPVRWKGRSYLPRVTA
jgi:cellulose synthase/poly-beta-1,6-N-acetylglucosamine synthase-like glycosyltransferase